MKDDEKPKISYLKNVKKNDDGSVDIELSGNEEDLISDEDISPKEFVGMLKSIFDELGIKPTIGDKPGDYN